MVRPLDPLPTRPPPDFVEALQSPPKPECDHKYVLAGVVHSRTEYPLPGSGAYGRVYEDHYFCERCLDQQYLNPRTKGNTYGHPIAGTMPK